MHYWMVSDASLHWDMEPQNVRALCRSGGVAGARRVGELWLIPACAKPSGMRGADKGRGG